jgi:hypothetical protein
MGLAAFQARLVGLVARMRQIKIKSTIFIVFKQPAANLAYSTCFPGFYCNDDRLWRQGRNPDVDSRHLSA